VLPEWQKQTAALGDSKDVARFVSDTLQIAGSPLSPVRNTAYKLTIDPLPEALKERIKEAGFEKPFRLDFEYPPEKQTEFLHRSQPVVSLLADYVLESALESQGANDPNINLAARCGVYEMETVKVATTLCLLRLRHKIEIKRGKNVKNIVAEEALLVGFEGRANAVRMANEKIFALLKDKPSGNLSKAVIERELQKSLDWYKASAAIFDAIAKEKSASLLADHRRVRDASRDRGEFAVEPSLPVDLIGLYVILPKMPEAI
jgi:hypothetical protein